MAVVTAVIVGCALGGAAVWSLEVLMVVRHVQTDVCVIDDRQLAELFALGQHPAQLQLPGCP